MSVSNFFFLWSFTFNYRMLTFKTYYFLPPTEIFTQLKFLVTPLRFRK